MRIDERSPYLDGTFAPTQSEITAHDLDVIGELPADLDGMFIRTGSNPRFEPVGRYHWFDGDGMLHGVHVANGSATYRNRYVRTEGLAAEEAEGRAVWTGILERPDLTSARSPYKDTANTTITFHAGKLLAHWWLSGASYVIDLPSLETVGTTDFGGYAGNMNAHPKVDPRTGELVFIDYGPVAPYLSYGVVGAGGTIAHHTTIELPGPRLQHDLAITEDHAILLDMSMMWDPESLKQGKIRNGFFRDVPTSIGVIPRRGTDADVVWFEAEPFFMYHTINAWQDGDEIVLVGCRIADPLTTDPNNPRTDRVVPAIANLRLDPNLHEWRMNLQTGLLKEEPLDDRLGEFPTMDDRSLGARTSITYMPRMAPSDVLLFDGVLVYTDDRVTAEYAYPSGWFGGELAFAPRVGASVREDDGYLLTFVSEASSGVSELYVFDAARISDGPVARLPIPQRVPTGYHTEWVAGTEFQA